MFLMAWAALEDGDLIEIRNFIRHTTRVNPDISFLPSDPVPLPKPPVSAGGKGTGRKSESPRRTSPNRGRSPKGKTTAEKPSSADSQNNNNRSPPATRNAEGKEEVKTSRGTETKPAATSNRGTASQESKGSPGTENKLGSQSTSSGILIRRYRDDGSFFDLQVPKNFGSWRDGAAERARLARRAKESNPGSDTEAAVEEAAARVEYIKKLQGTRGKETPVTEKEFIEWLDKFGNPSRSAPPPGKPDAEGKSSNF